MRRIFLILAVAFAPVAMAEVNNAPSEEQIALSKNLPRTTIIRVSKTDPSKIEVVHSDKALKPGQKLKNPKFQEMALDGEQSGVVVTAGNELDATSSTSSWRFGYYGNGGAYGGAYGGAGYANITGPRGGSVTVAGGYRGGYAGAGYGGAYAGGYGGAAYAGGYGYPSAYAVGYNNCGGGCGGGCYQNCGGCYNNCCGGCQAAYYPQYVYAGYQYAYQPYWGYSDANYDYAYCNWGY